MSTRRLGIPLLCGLVTAAFAGCGSDEAPRVSLAIVVDTTGIADATTDLGYTVNLTTARTALRDLQLTTGGEAHASVLDRVHRWLVPVAHAHPGHAGGGEVTGELAGPLVVDWLNSGAVLGQASLIVGAYRGANFTFRRATAADGAVGDPLLGHTIHLEGTARKDGRAVSFVALVDIDEGAQLLGAPFDEEVREGVARPLGLRLLPSDPTDPRDTVWNGVDFFRLADAAGRAEPLSIAPGQESHNLLRRAFQVHDHYDLEQQ